jgi:hypothetical protein
VSRSFRRLRTPDSLLPTRYSLLPTPVAWLLICLAATACGKKGPPLPPLVKQPQAPTEVSAARHGDTVDVKLVVPQANVDGSRPANVARVDVYAITAPPTATEDQILKLGTKIGSIAVKAPRDPNKTIEPDESPAEIVPPEGTGVDQGAVAQVTETLTPEAAAAADLSKVVKPAKNAAPAIDETERPLLSPAFTVPTRLYAGVAVSAKGKRGPISGPAKIAMVDPPVTLPMPDVAYDEKAVTVTWKPIGGARPVPAPDALPVLPSRPIGPPTPTIAYNVYEISEETPPILTKLTATAVDDPKYSDTRIVWGQRRCYAVRAVETIDDVAVEGRESEARCVTLTDTFAPAAPTGLQAVASEGAINLIWDANTEKDVRGYVVLRALAPSEALEPVTAEPIRETSFKDAVKPGARFVFAVRAVDAAGNMSLPSARVEETAR